MSQINNNLTEFKGTTPPHQALYVSQKINKIYSDFSSTLNLNNLVVSNDVTFGGLNFSNGTIAAGRIISYIRRTEKPIPAATSRANLKLAPIGYTINDNVTMYDLDVYEVIYWGYDTRSSSLTKMSATLLVPTTIVNNKTLLSHKHGTLLTTENNCTVWKYLSLLVTTGAPTSFQPDLTTWFLSATTGYISIVADNPSYGASIGLYNYFDVFGEAQSQYNATVATRQLMDFHPELFHDKFVGAGILNVIVSGNSLGGVVAGQVAEFIDQNPDNKLAVINTIAYAPVNITALFTLIQDNLDKATSWIVAYFFMLVSVGNPVFKDCMLPNIYTDVLPLFNPLRLPNSKYAYAGTNSFFVEFATILSKSINASPDTYGHKADFNIFAPPTFGYVYFDTLFDMARLRKYVRMGQEITFYTSPFMDYSDLSGTPIHTIYSAYDELTGYNPDHPAVLTDSSNNFDGVHNYFRGWVTDTSFNNIYDIPEAPPVSSLKRSSDYFYEETNLALDPKNALDDNSKAITKRWDDSEGTNKCSNIRFNAGININHSSGGRVFGQLMSYYLINRGTK